MGTRTRYFFLFEDTEISEKQNFFVNRSVPENFQRENFPGQAPTESLRTQDSENVYERWVQQIFDHVLGRPKLGECEKMGSVSKIIRCYKKMYLPKSSDLSFQI